MFRSLLRSCAVSAAIMAVLGLTAVGPAAAAPPADGQPSVQTLQRIWSWFDDLAAWWSAIVSAKVSEEATAAAAEPVCLSQGTGEAAGGVSDPNGCS